MSYLLVLFFLPFISAIAIITLPKFSQTLTIASSALLALVSVLFFSGFDDEIRLNIPFHIIFTIADIALILFFIREGFRLNNALVWVFGALQLLLLFYVKSLHAGDGFDIYVDRLSALMFLLINIVGGTIAIYAIEYIKDEEFSEGRKRGFLAILVAFLGIMNVAVSLNSLEMFFLFFELTTLASYLLISYRKDEISIKNGLKALWMNEIGGVALLLGIIFAIHNHGTYFISDLNALEHSAITALPLAFLAIAAFIKGAQIPFSGWLLGAMVAPTPVSAMLHSATMVKIAPYIIARLSPAFSHSSVFYGIVLLGGFTFVFAALLALERDKFKEILAYSTISLLGLMIALSAFGNTYALIGVLLLVIFHGVSKAMLFMQAGIYEKKFHAKTIETLQGIALRSPRLAFFTILGFASITLPPFGVFLAKWYAREVVADINLIHMFTIYMLSSITVGSAILTVLYFRVGGILLPKGGEKFGYEDINLGAIYSATMYFLALLLFFGAIFIFGLTKDMFYLSAYAVTHSPISIAVTDAKMIFTFTSISYAAIVLAVLLIMIPFVAFFIHLRGVDRAKEYSCGEEIEFKNSSYILKLKDSTRFNISAFGALLFGVVLLLGVFG